MGKILASAESSHALEHQYNEGGRLQLVKYNGENAEIYRYNQLGQRVFSHVANSDKLEYRYNGQVFLFATYQLGSIFTVADLSGDSVQEVLYDSFGREIQNSSPELALPLGFAGGLHDADTGLIHFGYREYDPATGRFISPDPLGYAGGDVDLYGYCGDDPVNFVDRLGLNDTSEASEDEGAESDKENENFFWTVTPKKNACEKCQALKGNTFMKKRERPHPYCKSESFEFTKFGEIPVPWEVAITCDGADNSTITYSIRG